MNFKFNVGYLTEDSVQKIAEDAFSSDFVFRSPRREGGKEVTDVLVLFEDVALIIQSKAQAINLTNSEPSSSFDWVTKNLDKAGRQIRGAARAVRAGKMPYVENDRRGRVLFKNKDFPWLYGLVILHHQSEPYRPTELVPILREINIPVHVFSLRDFWNLSKFLDTPGDLINYLEHRTDVLLPTLNPLVHKEQEVWIYYLEKMEEIMTLRAKKFNYALTKQDIQSYAQGLRQIAKGKDPDWEYGLVIDHMIEKIHDVDPELEALRIGEKTVPRSDKATYAIIATELGKINRIRRIALGRRYLEKAKLARDSGQDHFLVTHSLRRGDCMLFLTSPLSRNQRKKRAEKLLHLTTLAKTHYQVHRAIGIATEDASRIGRSYDFLFLDSPPVYNHHTQEIAQQVFGKSNRSLFD